MEWSTNELQGRDALTSALVSELQGGKKVGWFIPGGSNIPISVKVLKDIRAAVTVEHLASLTITLTDERYGPVGHKDSNWQQLLDAGFSEKGICTIPVLNGELLEETIAQWSRNVEEIFEDTDVQIAQFGIGADGHIAGALPHSPAISDAVVAVGYVSGPLTRVTLSTNTLARFGAAYVFAYGASKVQTLLNLRDTELSLEEQPSQVLKRLPEAHIYSDVSSSTVTPLA